MRIIISAQALVPWSGGSALSEGALCGHMSKLGEVSIICRQGALDYAFARNFGIREVCEYQQKEAFEAWRHKNHWLNQIFSQADICHLNGHWRWEDYFFARLCKANGIPYVLQPRGMLLLQSRNATLKRVYNFAIGNWIVKHASRVIALSQFEVEQLKPYGLDSKKIVIVPNGIPHIQDEENRCETSLSKVNPFFLYLGRIESRKNLPFLINVFARYVRDGGKSDLRLIGPIERNHDKELTDQIHRLEMASRVHLMSPVYDSEKWAIVKKAKAVVYPTIQEPFGRVPFEAISAGVFPIIPDQSGSSEYLRPFLPQCIYEHQNPDSLLKVIQRMDKVTSQDLPNLEKARSWVHAELNWDKIVGRINSLYENIISTSQTVRSLPPSIAI